MSYDRKIDFVCPHEVIEEALFVSSDRVTVQPVRAISNAASVRLRLDGLVEVPSQGVFTPATGIAARQGPFNIAAGVNDKLIVKVNSGPYQTITASPGQRLTAAQIAQDLATKISGVQTSVTPKRRLQLSTKLRGGTATLMIRSTGSTLASTLGLPVDRQFRGRQTFGGWSLIRDPLSRSSQSFRVIVFDRPLRGFASFVEINYTTVRSECRRCGGLGVENDWRYNVNGDVIEVRDEALLIQEIQKIMFTVQGSNLFNQWYGTNILDTVGKKLSASGIIQSFIVSDIRDAFRRWQSIKRQQEENVGQFVSDEEFPFLLQSVQLVPDPSDPTILFVNATIQNRSDRPIQLSRGVRLPLPTDILGSSTQDGIFRQSITGPAGVDTVYG